MDIRQIINDIIVFYQNAPVVAIAIALVAILLIFRYTKLFLKVIILALLLSFVFYVITNVASKSVSEKEKLIRKDRLSDTDN